MKKGEHPEHLVAKRFVDLANDTRGGSGCKLGPINTTLPTRGVPGETLAVYRCNLQRRRLRSPWHSTRASGGGG
jgi:hypothetical protein